MEARDFHDLFGADIATVSMVWNMLWEDGIHPKKSKPKHLVWMLYLLKIKIYPNHGMCGGIMHPEGSPSWPFAGTESLWVCIYVGYLTLTDTIILHKAREREPQRQQSWHVWCRFTRREQGVLGTEKDGQFYREIEEQEAIVESIRAGGRAEEGGRTPSPEI